MKNIFLTFILIGTLTSHVAFAQTLDEMDAEIYQKTLRQCQGVMAEATLPEQIKSDLNKIWDGANAIWDMQLATDFIKNRGISQELTLQMSSESFYRALNDCSEGDVFFYYILLAQIVSQDVAKTGVGVVAMGLALSTPQLFLKWLQTSLVAAPGAFAQGMGSVVGLLNKGINLIGWAYLSWGGYKIYELHTNPAGAIESMIDAIDFSDQWAPALHAGKSKLRAHRKLLETLVDEKERKRIANNDRQTIKAGQGIRKIVREAKKNKTWWQRWWG